MPIIPYSVLASGPYLHTLHYLGGGGNIGMSNDLSNFSLEDLIGDLYKRQLSKEASVLDALFNSFNLDGLDKETIEMMKASGIMDIKALVQQGKSASGENAVQEKLDVLNKLLEVSKGSLRKQGIINNSEIDSKSYVEAINQQLGTVFKDGTNTELRYMSSSDAEDLAAKLMEAENRVRELGNTNPMRNLPGFMETINSVITKIHSLYNYCATKSSSIKAIEQSSDGKDKKWEVKGSLNKNREQYTKFEAYASIQNSGAGFLKYFTGNANEINLANLFNNLNIMFNVNIGEGGSKVGAAVTGAAREIIGKKSLQIKTDVVVGFIAQTIQDYTKADMTNFDLNNKLLMKISVKNVKNPFMKDGNNIVIHNGGSIMSFAERFQTLSGAANGIGSKFQALHGMLTSNSFQYHYVNQMAGDGSGTLLAGVKNMLTQAGFLFLGVELEAMADRTLNSSVNFYSDGNKIYSVSSFLGKLRDRAAVAANISVSGPSGNEGPAQKAARTSEIATNPKWTNKKPEEYYGSEFIGMGMSYGSKVLSSGSYKVSASLFFG